MPNSAEEEFKNLGSYLESSKTLHHPNEEPFIMNIEGTKYDTGFIPLSNENPNVNYEALNEYRGQQQSTASKLGAGLVNTATGLVFDTLKDVSYLFDWEQVDNLIDGTEKEFSNWFADLMEQGKQSTKIDVFRTKDSLGFNPFSAGWWADAMPSLASSLSMIIPARMAVKGLGALGSALKGGEVLKKLGWSTQTLEGVSGAVVSRYMENTMEGYQTFQTTYNEAINNGKSEDEAKKIAGEAARNNWYLNSLMLGQDIPQFMALTKGFKGASKVLSGQGFKELSKQFFSEGSEELYQHITDKEASRNALVNNKVIKDDNSSFTDRLLEYSKDGDFWTAGFLGGLGGGIFGAYGINQNQKYQKQFDNVYNDYLTSYKGLLKNDPETYNRGIEGAINKHITEHIANGSIDKFQSTLETILNNPERIRDIPEKTEQLQNVKKTLEQIEFAKDLDKQIKNDNSVPDNLKLLKFNSLLYQRSAENRLQEIQAKLNPILSKDLIHLPPDVHAYKQLKLTYEAIKDIPNMQVKVKEIEQTLKNSVKELAKVYKKGVYSISGATGELNKMIISSHDEELKKLLGNKEIENDILNHTRGVIFDLNTKESQDKQLGKLQNKKQEVEEKSKESNIKYLAEELAKGATFGDKQTNDFINENKEAIDKEVSNIQKKKEKEVEQTQKPNNQVTYEGKQWNIGKTYEKQGKKFVKIHSLDKKTTTELPIDQFNKLIGQVDITDKNEGINEGEVENQFIQDNKVGKISISVFKTELGTDDNTIPYRERYFRYLEKNKVSDKKLLIVTKKNNLTLYNEILTERKDAKKFEEDYKKKEGKEYDGIYTVLVDKDLNPIKVDGKLLHSTISSEKGLQERAKKTGEKIPKEEIQALTKLREQILKETNSKAYLTPNGKSKGIPQFESRINGKRPSKSVIGRITNDIKELELQLITSNNAYHNNQKLDAGKVYAINKEGRLFDLIPRLINNEEAVLVLELINQYFGLSSKTIDNPKLEAEKLVQFVTSDKNPQFNLQINKQEQTLTIGDKILNPEQILQSQNEIIDFLKTKRFNVNKAYQFNSPFDAPSLNKDNIKKYDTYKEFLLEGEEPKLGTDLNPDSKVQFKNIYITYDNSIKTDTLTKEVKESSKDIEAKKADIERRRQEELDELENELMSNGINLGVNDLKQTAEKIIDDIQSPFVKQVLKALLNLISKTGATLEIVREGGIGYNPSKNRITIGLDTILDGFNRNREARSKGISRVYSIKYGKSEATAISYFATTLLHEIVHTFTSKQIDVFTGKTQGSLTEEETNILTQLQKIFELVKTNPSLKGEYGLYDLHELIAEMFSNETFADKLKNIKLPKELQYRNKSKNLFDGIIDLIADLITKAIKGFNRQNISNEETAFQSISNLVNDLINAKYDAELAALEKTNKKEEIKPINIDDIDWGDEKLDRTFNPNLNQLRISQEEINWFTKNFPRIPLVTIQGLIENKSLGRFISAGRVLLSTEATVGTLKHEAFHTVTQLYLSKKEIDLLYKEASKKHPKATRFELEEILAEDFVNYSQTGKILSNRTTRNSIFRRLLNFVKDLIGLKATSIEDIYRRIDKGFYKKADVIGVREFTKLDRALPNKDEKFTKDLLDGIDAWVGEILYKGNVTPDFVNNNKTKLVSLVKQRFDKLKSVNKDNSLFDYIDKHWDDIIDLWTKRLDSLGITLTNEEQEENISEEENKTTRGFELDNKFEHSVKDFMSNNTRLMIKFLKTGKKNELGLPELVDFSSTYNYLLKKLQGQGSDYNNYYNKLQELVKDKPEFQQIIDKLGKPSGQISDEQMRFQTQFVRDFNKNRFDSYITFLKSDGTFYTLNANRVNEAGKVKEIWRTNLINKVPQNKEGKQLVNPEIIKYPNLKFLEAIGITFSKETLDEIKNDLNLSESVARIKDYITANNYEVSKLFDENQDISGKLNYLLDLEAQYTPNVNELSYVSADGKTQYSIAENNELSIIKNIINNAKTKEELFAQLPHLNTVSNQNSAYINLLFDKDGVKRKGVTLNLDLFNGVQSKDRFDGFGKSTRELSPADLWLQQLTNILTQGKHSYIVSSDKSSEFSISLTQGKQKLIIPISEFKDGFNSTKLNDIFRGYFKDEFNRIVLYELNDLGKDIDQYNKAGDNWTIFANIVPAEIRKEIIESLKQWKKEDKTIEDVRDQLNELYLEALNNTNLTNYFDNYYNEVINKLDKYKIEELVFSKELLKNNSKEQLIRAAITNDLINSIEQTKIFLGDLAFYKDLYKRTSGASGTKEIPRVDNEIDEFLNENYPRQDKKLANGKINIAAFEDIKAFKKDLNQYISLLVKKQNLTQEQAEEVLNAYTSMAEGDAQGWITLDEYREFFNRLGQWLPKHENTYNKLINNEKVTGKELTWFLTLKAQYFGPQEHELFAPAFHKFSLMPLIPSMIKGTHLEQVLSKMQEQQIGYALFKSGSKVGTKVDKKSGKTNDFYGKKWNNIQTIYYQFLGLQQKSSEPHDKVIFGTQFRKLLFVNLFENGKETFKGGQKLFDEYDSIISKLINREKAKLIKELGIDPENYSAKDVTKLVELLQDEAKARKLPDNIIDSLQTEEINGQIMLKYKFDQMVNKPKIDSMITSLVNSRIIRQKMNGDAYVQGSVAGFEKLARSKDKDKWEESNELAFYTEDKPYMEIKIAMGNNYKHLLTKYGSLEALNKAIKNEEIDEELLHIVGYRIPTQGFNSMESMRIAEFLPEESGTTIIVPSALVAKSGGDFDIDKLFIFRPNLLTFDKEVYYLNKDNKEKLKKELQDAINLLKKEKHLENIKENSSVNLISSIFGIEFSNNLEELKEEVNKLEKDLNGRIDFLIDQNRIIEIAKEIIEHPYNFASLITPNSTILLKEVAEEVRYSKYLNSKLEKSENPMTKDKWLEMTKTTIKYDDKLKLHNKIDARYALWLAKDEVGIAAVANTFNVLSQIGNLSLNVNKESGQGVINFKHNQTEDGKVDISRIKDANGQNNISEINSQVINGTVDAASEEEPTIFHLNMTMETLPVYLYLNKAGVPFDLVGYFMTQPIILKYLQAKSVNSSGLLKITGEPISNKELREQVESEYNSIFKGKVESVIFDNADQLKQWLLTENQEANKEEFAKTQLQVLDDYLRYKNDAKSLQDAVRAVNHDTNGVGQNLNEAHLKIELLAQVQQEGFVNGIENVLKTFIGTFDQNDFMLKAFSQFYNTQDPKIYANTKNIIDRLTLAYKNRFKFLSPKDKIKTFSLIENEFINYVVQNYGYSNISTYRNKIFKTDSVAKKLLEIKNNPNHELYNNLLIKELYPILNSKLGENSTGQDNIKIYAKRFDTFTSNSLTESFREIKDKDANLAKELMDIGIIQSGLTNSPITYLGIIPEEYYNTLVKQSFNEFDKKNGVDELEKFNQLLLRNNSNSTLWPLASTLKLNRKTSKDKKTIVYDNTLGFGMFGRLYDKSLYDPKLKTIEVKKEDKVENKTEEPKIDSSKKINIYAGTNENTELSNFAYRPFLSQLGEFNTVEHAFQFAKAQFTTHEEDLGYKIANAKTPAEAKALGRKIKGLDIKAWDNSSSKIMKELIKQSFEQNPKALEKLLATGNAELTHIQDKTKWGKEFPKLLMEVREELSPKKEVESITSNDTDFNMNKADLEETDIPSENSGEIDDDFNMNKQEVEEEFKVEEIKSDKTYNQTEKEIQELWEQYRERISKKHPETDFLDFYDSVKQKGIDFIKEYLKKCYG